MGAYKSILLKREFEVSMPTDFLSKIFQSFFLLINWYYIGFKPIYQWDKNFCKISVNRN